MKETLVHCVKSAGAVLLDHFGRAGNVSRKENQSSIVTEADLAAERCILDIVRRAHPNDNILSEESGLHRGTSNLTWVIDPLDGTSNFAHGVPWFGVLMAVLQDNRPVMGVMYFPTTEILYFSEAGAGVDRDGTRVQVSSETDLSNVLCAYAVDAGAEESRARGEADLFRLLVERTRNTRTTNCLVDFCYAIDGRFGGCINQVCKIWDIAAACLMFREAGGRLTDFSGREITFAIDPSGANTTYSVVGANPDLHRQLVRLVNQAGLGSSSR